MSRNEDKLMARFLPKPLQQQEGELSVFAKPWYLDWWLPKLLFVLGFFAILWKLFDIIILGRWL